MDHVKLLLYIQKIQDRIAYAYFSIDYVLTTRLWFGAWKTILCRLFMLLVGRTGKGFIGWGLGIAYSTLKRPGMKTKFLV